MVCCEPHELNIWRLVRSAFQPLSIKALRGYDNGFVGILKNEEEKRGRY
jgi:hypothetical protein